MKTWHGIGIALPISNFDSSWKSMLTFMLQMLYLKGKMPWYPYKKLKREKFELLVKIEPQIIQAQA
jgi:hypothetical protein